MGDVQSYQTPTPIQDWNTHSSKAKEVLTAHMLSLSLPQEMKMDEEIHLKVIDSS